MKLTSREIHLIIEALKTLRESIDPKTLAYVAVDRDVTRLIKLFETRQEES
jgi:Fe-S-cluster formation regulator IscX/YfhJ